LRQERRRHFAPVDITGPAWDLVLVLLGLAGEERNLCVGELAMRASIPRTTTVRWVRQLHRYGFVTLSGDSKDKRAVRVQLTAAGERAAEAAFASANLKVR
jgi:DNA-binding MarR family transcriptional regulator